MPIRTLFLLALILTCSNHAIARKKKAAKKQAQSVTLTAKGKQLEAKFTKELNVLREQIKKALPTISTQKKAAFQKAFENERSLLLKKYPIQTELKQWERKLSRPERTRQKIKERAEFIKELEQSLKQAKAAGKNSEEIAAMKKKLAKLQQNHKKSDGEMKKAEAFGEKARINVPKLTEELKNAEAAQVSAHVKSMKLLKECGVAEFLKRNALDAKLAKYMVMSEASPRLLAGYAQQGSKQKAILDSLLANPKLMMQMVVADGAKFGLYGKAMEIYTAIQKAHPKSKEGILQRLAVAVSLVHAFPIAQKNPKAQTKAPEFVDPVGRYLSYEKAYLNNELDPTFKDQTVWNLTFVVDGYEPDESSLWGREMLRNYRPDHITYKDYRWRYVVTVASDVDYIKSKARKDDLDELYYFQNILKNGGICGRRAFFGRFILRAFGIPTTARPQKGHGALTHWTPDGWAICLGSEWGAGFTQTRYRRDLDFLANTQGRENARSYLQVKRAQWIGDIVGEDPAYGLVARSPAFWHGASLCLQQNIISTGKSKVLEAVGVDLAEANESKEEKVVKTVTIPEKDRQIRVTGNGTITIPATACSKPTTNTPKIKFMECVLGGMQLHYENRGRISETFEYTVSTSKTGKYNLVARVVTPTDQQFLTITVNNTKPIDIPLPFTIGMWEKTKPVKIELRKGKNILRFSREHDKVKGLTIKDFTLTPSK